MSENENPYQQPEAELMKNEVSSGNLTGGVASRPIGYGWRWIVEGFRLFKLAPGTWIGTGIIFLIVLMVMAFIPIIGTFAAFFLLPVFMAGFMIACQSLQNGDGMEIGHLFAGFKKNTGQLVLVGVFYMLLCILAFIPMGVMMGSTFMQILAASENPEAMADITLGPSFYIGYLLTLLIYFPVLMSYWFAPALVGLNDMPAVAAMKMSFSGCLKNMLPFFWYGIVALVLYFLSILPLALGLLVFMPTIVASIYTSYKSIYLDA